MSTSPCVSSPGKVIACFLAGILLCSLGACSREGKAIKEIEKEFERKNHKEVVFLCQHAIDDNIESGPVYYYCGLSLLALGRDFEAFDHLEHAVMLDTTNALPIARRLLQAGESDFEDGRTRRAAQRMMEAAKIDSSLDLGAYAYLVADQYYHDRDFPEAAYFYERGFEIRPDTSIAEESLMRLAKSYARIDSVELAEAAYSKLVDLFPHGDYANDARYNLASSMLDRAGHQLELGNFEDVLSIAEELLDITKNVTLMQNARFLMGEAFEGLSDYDAALEQYKLIIQYDRGSSGSVVNKARDKIESYRRAGLVK